MTPSDRCLDMIKGFEGLRLEAYQDPAGVWTIGYGHTENVHEGDKVTEAQAHSMLLYDLVDFSANVKSYNNQYHWTQNEYDALLSFAYNIGSIDQLTGYGRRSKEEIAEKMLCYVYAGGEVMPGLLKRRQAEHDLFLSSPEVEWPTFPVLRYGSEGDLVKVWQIFLKIPVDGIFGTQTESCIRAYQAKESIDIDGIIGSCTWGRFITWLQKNSIM